MRHKDLYPSEVLLTTENIEQELEKHNSSNRPLARAAFEMGCEVTYVEGLPMFRATYKNKEVYFYMMENPLNSYVNSRIANSKYLTKIILHKAGSPIAKGIRVTKSQWEKKEYSDEGLSYPLLIKPAEGTTSGNGIISHIRSTEELENALQKSFLEYSHMVVEEFYGGLKDYRVMVLDDDVIGVTYRIAAHVIGDGEHTIEELIEQKNIERAKFTHINFGPIRRNEELLQQLSLQQVEFNSIIPAGKHIQLQQVANFGAGGEIEDATDDICPENKQLAIQATRALGLRLAGIDILCHDIRQPIQPGEGVIIEVNPHPNVTGHHYPLRGKSRNVSQHIIEAIFSE